MRKVYKQVKSNYGGHFWTCPVMVPSSKRDKKILKIKYSNMDTYGTTNISKCNECEKSLIITAFVLHHLDGEVLFAKDGSFTTPAKFTLTIDVEYDDAYIETDEGWLMGVDRTPSNEAFFMADYINRPRKLKRVLEQYSYDERRRWKEIIRYYRKWANSPDAIVIK